MSVRKGFPLVALALFVALLVPGVSMAASDPASVPTVQVVESTADGLVLDIDVAGLTTTEIEQAGVSYRYLSLPYSGVTSQVGKPALPTFGRFVALPQGARVEVEILDAVHETIPDLLIYPAQEPQYDCVVGKEIPPFVLDQGFYDQDTLYPGQVVMAEEPRSLRGVPVTVVRFFPYQYNPATQELTAYSHLRVRLRFVGAEGPFVNERYRAESFEGLYAGLLLNYDQLGAPQPKAAPQSPSGAEFLIITHPDFVSAANDLAAWRNANGLDTEVRTTDQTGATAAEIQAYIQNAYDTWNPPPEFVLFVGDHEWIPTNYSGDTATDLYYLTVDGPDYYPDIHGGRISVDSLAEAHKTVDDIINYDQNPVTDEAFYNNATHAAYFQDDEGDGYESRRFVRTSEEIRDFLLAEGYTAERIYFTESYINPTNYNNGPYGNGEPLPPDLLRPGFAWDGDAADITAAVEAGRFLLTHRDHGFYGGWGEPGYDVDDVLALTNGNLLPVVFSMNCQSGGFDSSTDPCFTEAWLRNPNGGAVGVIGATRNSYSGYNDFMTLGLVDAIWPDFLPEVIPGFDLPEYRMGVVLNYGKYIMEITWGDPWGYQQLEWELFHYFGDPTMGIHVAPPFPDFTLSADPDAFEVCAPEVVTSTIEVGQIITYAEDVTLEVLNVPAGVSADITPVVVTPPGTATLTLDVGGGAADGAYTLIVSGTAEMTNVHTVAVDLFVSSAVPGAPTLLFPPDGAVDVPRTDTLFEWSAVAEASAYRLQVDDDPAFGSPDFDVTGITTDTYTLVGPLELLTTYYWRVSGANGCGEGAFSEAFSFTVQDLPCILLVDDDNDNPDVLPYYTAALDSLGYEYDVFDVGGGSGEGPSLAEMLGYEMILWFSGDKFSSSAGPNGTDETNLAAYLDGGGKLFLSSQDYLYDFGLTSFGEDYLGIGTYTNDDGNASTKYGVSGDPIGDGLGPYSLSYPANFSDYGDIVNAGAGASVAFTSSAGGGNNLDVDKDGGDWRTVFFGTSWVTVHNGSAANGEQVLGRIIDWFGGCECVPVSDAEFDWTPLVPVTGEGVTFTGSAQGSDPIAIAWNLGDGGVAVGASVVYTYTQAGDYTVVMTATNGCGLEVVSDTITIDEQPCDPVTDVNFGWMPPEPLVGQEVDFVGEASGTLPISFTWAFGDGGMGEGQAVAHTYTEADIYAVVMTATNCGESWMATTYAVTVSQAPVCTDVANVDLARVTVGTIYTDTLVEFEADVAPDDASKPYSYTVDYDDGTVVAGDSSDDPLALAHTFAATGTYAVEVAVWNCEMEVPATDVVTVTVYEPGACVDLAGITIQGETEGEPGVYTFTTSYEPVDATPPISYTWDNGNVGSTSVRNLGVGPHTLLVTATNCAEALVTGTHTIVVSGPVPEFYIYLPLVLRNSDS